MVGRDAVSSGCCGGRGCEEAMSENHDSLVARAIATCSALGAFWESAGGFATKVMWAALFALVTGVMSKIGAWIGGKIIRLVEK